MKKDRDTIIQLMNAHNSMSNNESYYDRYMHKNSMTKIDDKLYQFGHDHFFISNGDRWVYINVYDYANHTEEKNSLIFVGHECMTIVDRETLKFRDIMIH